MQKGSTKNFMIHIGSENSIFSLLNDTKKMDLNSRKGSLPSTIYCDPAAILNMGIKGNKGPHGLHIVSREFTVSQAHKEDLTLFSWTINSENTAVWRDTAKDFLLSVKQLNFLLLNFYIPSKYFCPPG